VFELIAGKLADELEGTKKGTFLDTQPKNEKSHSSE
jgi:hypothetical protein